MTDAAESNGARCAVPGCGRKVEAARELSALVRFGFCLEHDRAWSSSPEVRQAWAAFVDFCNRAGK